MSMQTLKVDDAEFWCVHTERTFQNGLRSYGFHWGEVAAMMNKYPASTPREAVTATAAEAHFKAVYPQGPVKINEFHPIKASHVRVISSMWFVKHVNDRPHYSPDCLKNLPGLTSWFDPNLRHTRERNLIGFEDDRAETWRELMAEIVYIMGNSDVWETLHIPLITVVGLR